ncbi:MAG: site-2 protease family protein [Hydrogenophilales bacterium CG17_big_fil_post_rev_8_21_14_2_50_63_12]|nr:MAG: site-2 protease family protein [Hydrogenophilales bacterium CG17_big_fil_post_rev_8_21_14_2_50_63_12]PIX96601.1 MAG: site-2 protease family protein [Hydrogenophilales bacterium CG_4_10_14_3_um_filter_63_21]PJB03426.1 MAG: site-2 protease family protein [Hydrogenophilales bacterium CG_4_9_14_3_um_filter_63_34]
MELNLIQKIAVFALPVLFAITLHEAAHGYAALRFGDRTAQLLGRISLNPLRHIDLVGTIIVPLSILLITKLSGGAGILFGWAKPVPVNFNQLRRPKQDMLWVAAAGPGANLLMALIWAGMIKLALAMPGSPIAMPLALMGAAGIFINAVLMALNLIPLPPLDGGRIAVSLLPTRLAIGMARIEPYGLFILLGLMFLGILGILMWPLIQAIIELAAFLFGLEPIKLLAFIQIVLN